MGLDTLADKNINRREEEVEEKENDDWMVITVDIEMLINKETDITVKASEKEEFRELVESEMEMFEAWILQQLYEHPDVIVSRNTDINKLMEKHFDD